MKFIFDSLIAMGKGHELHCEDDMFIKETDKYVIAAVFDGCSSGIDSHYASTTHKYILRELMKEEGEYLIKENHNKFFPYKDCKNTLRDILYNMLYELGNYRYIVGKEMLSTCVILFINKAKKTYGICFAGDGCCNINGEIHSVHDKDSNAVWYLSTVEKEDFDKYFNEYCTVYTGTITDNCLIQISSDGIESFSTKYGQTLKELGYQIFFERKELSDKHKELKLKNLYNVLTRNKLTYLNIENVKNIDDLTIISIKSIF